MKVWKWLVSKLGFVFGFIVAIFTLKLFRKGGGLLPDVKTASDRVEDLQEQREDLEENYEEKLGRIDDTADDRIVAWRKRVQKLREEADRKAREANEGG